ncbi:MAG: glycosyltransferase family 39 protein, partial [Candidatus Micrarchaeia archaeon]
MGTTHSDRTGLIVLAITLVCSFFVHLAFMSMHPMYLDEALYAKMVMEQQEHLTMVPTYLGYDVGWKPPLFYWVFSFLTRITSALASNVDFIYKFPNIMLGMVNIALTYWILRRRLDAELACMAIPLYAFCALFIYTNERVLLDPLTMVFILGGICAYTAEASYGKKRFLLGGMMLLLAILTKSVVGLAVPAIAIAHLYQNERKTLRNPWFLISLLVIPLGLGVHYFSMKPDMAKDIFFIDIGGKLGAGNGMMEKIGGSFGGVFTFLNVLLVAAAVGFIKFWKEDYAMSVWLALGVFTFIGGSGMPWYSYVIVPAVVLFAAKSMQSDSNGKMRRDAFFVFLILFVIAINLLILCVWYFGTQGGLNEAKLVGEFIAGKPDVMIVGTYGDASIVTAYKLTEENVVGRAGDFGWVVIPAVMMNETNMSDFVENYTTSKYTVNEVNFARLFWTSEIFRKKTGIEEFG